MPDLSYLKKETLNIENHCTTQKAYQPTLKNKEHSYKEDENIKVLVYCPLTIFYDSVRAKREPYLLIVSIRLVYRFKGCFERGVCREG